MRRCSYRVSPGRVEVAHAEGAKDGGTELDHEPAPSRLLCRLLTYIQYWVTQYSIIRCIGAWKTAGIVETWTHGGGSGGRWSAMAVPWPCPLAHVPERMAYLRGVLVSRTSLCSRLL